MSLNAMSRSTRHFEPGLWACCRTVPAARALTSAVRRGAVACGGAGRSALAAQPSPSRPSVRVQGRRPRRGRSASADASLQPVRRADPGPVDGTAYLEHDILAAPADPRGLELARTVGWSRRSSWPPQEVCPWGPAEREAGASQQNLRPFDGLGTWRERLTPERLATRFTRDFLWGVAAAASYQIDGPSAIVRLGMATFRGRLRAVAEAVSRLACCVLECAVATAGGNPRVSLHRSRP
jgi:hypothetical protein